MNKHYPDPYTEATTHTARKGLQLVSIFSVARQVVKRAIQRNRREEPRQEPTQINKPADEVSHWLRGADISQVARVWRVAMAHADSDSVAGETMNRCEERLRILHPYAMARYDRLRDDGMRANEAMTEVAPLFACRPFTRTGNAGPSPPALAATRTAADLVAEDFPHDIETSMRTAVRREPTACQSPPEPEATPPSPRQSVR